MGEIMSMGKMNEYYGADVEDESDRMSDYYGIEAATAPDFRSTKKRDKRRKTWWYPKNAAPLPIKEMTDTHLTNTIRMLWRNSDALLLHVQLNAYALESSVSGDAASDAADQAVRRAENMTAAECLAELAPSWKYLLREARKRRLAVCEELWFDDARAVAEDTV